MPNIIIHDSNKKRRGAIRAEVIRRLKPHPLAKDAITDVADGCDPRTVLSNRSAPYIEIRNTNAEQAAAIVGLLTDLADIEIVHLTAFHPRSLRRPRKPRRP